MILKFHGNLTSGEILNQIVSIPESGLLTNLVFMGMGEPMDNIDHLIRSLQVLTSDWGFAMSPSRITVSTVGVLPAMETFIQETRCHLAISLNSPFGDERKSLMPVENKYPVHQVVEFLKKQSFEKQRRISFEYILFRGINDSRAHVKAINRLLNGLRCRINLIRFHPIPEVSLEPPDEAGIERFRQYLRDKGIVTTVRASRGQDISAACGMLSTAASAGD